MTHDLLRHDDGCLGWSQCVCRLDEGREYERDAQGKFASTGDAADHADQHAERARAAATGSTKEARASARKSEESAALARVAHEYGDLATASAHAAAAERHADAALVKSGKSPWMVARQQAALKTVSASPSADAHREMAKAFSGSKGISAKHRAIADKLAASEGAAADSQAEHHGEGHRIGVGFGVRGSSPAEEAHDWPMQHEPSRQMRIGVTSHIAGEDAPPAPPASPEQTPRETSLDRLMKQRPVDRPRDVTFNEHDNFGKRAAENARQRAQEGVARARKAELDRQITAQHVTAKVVSLPSPVLRSSGLWGRVVSRLRGDDLTADEPVTYDVGMGISRDIMRHDDDCPGSEGCKCEDSEDCDDGLECDEGEEECVEREDGANQLRFLMLNRYGVDLSGTPAAEVARRASTILGVSTPIVADSSALSLLTQRARDAWRLDADREYERDEGGRFASTGAAAGAAKDHAEQARSAASGTTPSARASARKAEEHAALARVAHEHGDLAGANHHAAEARRHAGDVDRKVAAVRSPDERQTTRMPPISNKEAAAALGARVSAGSPTPAQRSPGPTRTSTAATTPIPTAFANQAASHSAAADRATAKAFSPVEHMAAAAMHDRAAHSARAAGDLEGAQRHAMQASVHGSKSSVPAGRAGEATVNAREASDRASVSKSPEAHREAAKAHGAALVENRAVGNTAQMNEHARAMQEHERQSMTRGEPLPRASFTQTSGDHVALTKAAEATSRANEASQRANTFDTPTTHLEAASRHLEALVANRAIGNAQGSGHGDSAETHNSRAAVLEAKASGVTLAQHAENTSSRATHATAEASTPIAHGEANQLHSAASRAYGALGRSLSRDLGAAGIRANAASMASLHDQAAEHHSRLAYGSSLSRPMRESVQSMARSVGKTLTQRRSGG